MDNTVLAAVIGFAGTVIAAVITATVGKITVPFTRRIQLLVGILILGVVVGALTLALLYDNTYGRLNAALPTQPGYKKVIYDRVGLGFSLPKEWGVDDASFRFASGDIDLIRDGDPEAGSIAQGIKLRFVNVQQNYVNNPNDEIENQRQPLEKFSSVVVDDVTLSGLPGKRFRYTQSTGARLGHIDLIWIRVTPRVKLAITAFSNLEGPARQRFENERDVILRNFVVDEKKMLQLAKRSGVLPILLHRWGAEG